MKTKTNELSLEIDRRYLKFYNFYKDAFAVLNPSTPLQENWHARKICNVLQKETYRIALGLPKTKDIIINVPFRTGKSEITSICWNAWSWIIQPSISFLSVSYSDTLSTEHSRKTRELVESDWYQKHFGHIVRISKNQGAKSHFTNTKKGARFATSTLGTATGMGGDILLFDDPMSPKIAASDAERKKANKAYSETFYSRTLNPETAVRVIIMQRLHNQDTTGYLLERDKEKYRHFCVPAELSNNLTPKAWAKHYDNDGLFWPDRFSVEILQDYKKQLGSYAYAGQLSQRPSPEEGGIWKRWFKPIDQADIPSGLLVNIGTDWDTAYTAKESNAANAYVTSAQHKGTKDIYILDAGYFWAETPELIRTMKTKQAPHYIEAKASGKSAAQFLRKDNVNAIEVKIEEGDKVARTRLVTPMAEAGRVFVASHILELLLDDDKQGILNFPNGSYADLNDALTQALHRHQTGNQLPSAKELEALSQFNSYEPDAML